MVVLKGISVIYPGFGTFMSAQILITLVSKHSQ